MKPLFFNPHDQRNPCREKSLGPSYAFSSPRMLDQYYLHDANARYRRNAPYGAGLVGGSAVVSEIVSHRLVSERPVVKETTRTVTEEPGRRVIVTTERLEIVTTVKILSSVVTSVPVSTGGGRSPERAQPKASE